MTKNTFKLDNLMFDPGKIKNEDDLLNFLDDYNNQNNKIDSWIDFRKFVNIIFSSYYSG